MLTTIQITAGKTKLKAQLNDCPTAKAILKALPIKAKGNRWGEEICFNIPVKAQLELIGRKSFLSRNSNLLLVESRSITANCKIYKFSMPL